MIVVHDWSGQRRLRRMICAEVTALLVAAGGTLVGGAGCAQTEAPATIAPGEAEPVTPPAPATLGETLVAPDLAGLEPAIQEQLKEVQAQVESAPEDAAAVGLLAMLYHGYGFMPEAQRAYERAAALEPESFRWRYLLAHALLVQQKLDDAIVAFRRAVELRPDYAAAQIALAHAYQRASRYDDALEVMAPLQKEHPDDPMINYTLGMTYKGLNEPIWAIQYLKPVVDGYPHFGGVRWELSRCFSQLGQEERAAEWLRGWKPNQATPVLRDPELVAIYRHARGTVAEKRKGMAYLRRGDSPKALEHFQKALSFSPDDREAQLASADALVNMGEYRRGEEILRRVLARNESDLPALIRMAHLYITQEDYERAAPIVEKAGRLEERNSTIMAMQARLAVERHDYEAAVAKLEELAAANPRSAAAFFELGNAYEQAHRTDAAKQAFLRVVELVPRHAEAMEALADLYWTQGAREAASNWCRRAFEAGSRLARTYLEVAAYAVENADYGRAVELLTQGLKDHPGNADLADTLARVYSMCPDAAYRDGAEALRIARELYGSGEDEIPVRGLSTLAAAHAEVGDFDEAVRLTKEAIRRAEQDGDGSLLRRLNRDLSCYENGKRRYEAPQ